MTRRQGDRGTGGSVTLSSLKSGDDCDFWVFEEEVGAGGLSFGESEVRAETDEVEELAVTYAGDDGGVDGVFELLDVSCGAGLVAKGGELQSKRFCVDACKSVTRVGGIGVRGDHLQEIRLGVGPLANVLVAGAKAIVDVDGGNG